MAHAKTQLDPADKEPIGAKLWPTFRLLGAAALIGLVLLVIGVVFESQSDGGDWKGRFFFAYLIGYCFVVGLTVGSVALVILTHLFRAGWVVAVRRVPETFAANFWFVAILGIPILFAVGDKEGRLYPWSESIDSAEANLHTAEETIHGFEYPHDAHHGDHEAHPEDGEHHEDEDANHAPDSVQTDTGAEWYAANVPGEGPLLAAADDDDEGHGTADGLGHATGNEDYQAAANRQRDPGMAYPDDLEYALDVQEAYYHSLLYYMLDYKAYGGELAGESQVPTDKGYYWYNPFAFVIRLAVYMGVLSLIGWFYWKKSIQQDETGDPELSTQREWWSPLSTVAFALTVTFMAFDLLMSLDPAWYSTMFGVIFFANSFTAGIALTILVCMILQKKGYLKTVNTEHYHDLGKLLFAFVFFWGYVSFSQFMLIWYASLPETTYWFEIHGMTTVQTAPQYGSDWTIISLVMLFGHLLVPFGFLLSRHVKRNLTALAFAATWMLLMVYLDFYWYAMPFFDPSPDATFGLPEIGAVVLLTSAVLAQFVRRYARHAPLAHGDPRLHESTALDTNVWAPIHH